MDPENAFALLGNEMRLDIVQALGEAETPLSFSALRERVGARDSGQFNYHLGKLVGTFVAGGDDGYSLRHPGLLVYGAVLAGSITAEAGQTADVTVDVEEPCPACGGPIEAVYCEERMTVSCLDCGNRYGEATVPPGVFEGYETDSYPRVFDRYVRELVGRMRQGFCTVCSGRVESGLIEGEEGPLVAYDCTRCPESAHSSPEAAVLEHPAVVAFYYEDGVDLAQRPLWGLQELSDVETTGTVDGVTVRFETDTSSLELVIDEDAAVVETRRDP
jgi:hypothetical protein